MCVDCHLAPEQKDPEIRPGLYPKPPNLSEQCVDPKTAFWVIKHGLKMTGMTQHVFAGRQVTFFVGDLS